MAKRVKVHIDSNDIFYDGMHDTATKQKIMKSPLWPVVVALYSHCEKEVRVGPVHFDDNGQHIYHFMTPSGFLVAALSQSGSSIRVMNADHPMTTSSTSWVTNYSTRLDTNNVRYAVSKLSPSSTHDVKECLSNSLTRARNGLATVIHESINNILRKTAGQYGSSKPSISIDSSLATTLVRIVVGNEDKSAVSQKDLNDMDVLYRNYLIKVEQFVGMVDKTKKMFTGDKWVVVPNMLGGIIVGAITPQPMLAACDMYIQNGYLPSDSSYTYLDRVVPFKWYKNYESIPDDLRQELDLSLLMLRTHTNSTEQFPTSQAAFEMWDSVEAFTTQDYITGHARVFVLSK